MTSQKVFVKFYAPWCGHCKAMAPTWDALSDQVTGATIAKVDCTQEAALCGEFGVQGYPTLILKDGDSYIEHNGPRSADALKAFLADPSSGDKVTRTKAAAAGDEETSNVFTLTADNFESKTKGKAWLLKFYAPWCGHCKNLAPTWDMISVDLGDDGSDVSVGKIDCTAEGEAVCKQFGVRGYPTLIAKTAGGKFYRYKGARGAEALKAWAADMTTDAEEIVLPFVLNTGIPLLDDNFEMMRDDMISLYNYKKAALGVVFGVGTLVGLVLSTCLCGGSSSKKAKKE